MKIKLDDTHYMNSDPYCYWITEVVKGKDGKKREERVSGYCSGFGKAVDDFVEVSVGRTTAHTLKKLKEEISELKKTVLGWNYEE